MSGPKDKDGRPVDVELHTGSGEWSALYVNGKLDRVGDHYLADERIQELFGVTVVHSDDFMRGQDKSDGVAQTLVEVEQYAQDRADRQARAKRLREQAADLAKEAADLEAGKIK